MRRKPLCLTFLLIFTVSVVLSNRFLAQRIALLPEFTDPSAAIPVESPTDGSLTAAPADPPVDKPLTATPADPPAAEPSSEAPIDDPLTDSPAIPPLENPITEPVSDPVATPTVDAPLNSTTDPGPSADVSATTTPESATGAEVTAVPDPVGIAPVPAASENYFVQVASPREVIAALATIEVPRTGGELSAPSNTSSFLSVVANTPDGLGAGSNLVSDATTASDPVSLAISSGVLSQLEPAHGSLWLDLLATLIGFALLFGLFSLAVHFLR